MKFPARLSKFADKAYRDGFLRTQIGGGIAYQIQALRAKLGMTQAQFGALVGKPQTVISRLENSASAKVGVQTLLDIATGADVALLVQFVSYPEFLRRTADMSVAGLQPDTIQESLAGARMPRLRLIAPPLRDVQSARPDNGVGLDLSTLLGGSPMPMQGTAEQPKPEAMLWN